MINNGIITAPVGIADVKAVLGAASNDVGTLCGHPNINKWSYRKPIIHPGPGVLAAPDYENYSDGFQFRPFTNVKALWQALQDGNVWVYNKPHAAMNPVGATGVGCNFYRLTDFNGYNKNQLPWIVLDNGQVNNYGQFLLLDLTVNDNNSGEAPTVEGMLQSCNFPILGALNSYRLCILLFNQDGTEYSLLPFNTGLDDIEQQPNNPNQSITREFSPVLRKGDYYAAVVFLEESGGDEITEIRNAELTSTTQFPSEAYCLSDRAFGPIHVTSFVDQIHEWARNVAMTLANVQASASIFPSAVGPAGVPFTSSFNSATVSIVNDNNVPIDDVVVGFKIRWEFWPDSDSVEPDIIESEAVEQNPRTLAANSPVAIPFVATEVVFNDSYDIEYSPHDWKCFAVVEAKILGTLLASAEVEIHVDEN